MMHLLGSSMPHAMAVNRGVTEAETELGFCEDSIFVCVAMLKERGGKASPNDIWAAYHKKSYHEKEHNEHDNICCT